MNKKYSAEIEQFIRDQHYMPSGDNLTDEELTFQINKRFGTNLNKAAVRKKRQRMGLDKSRLNTKSDRETIQVSQIQHAKLEKKMEENLKFLEEVIFGRSKDLGNSP